MQFDKSKLIAVIGASADEAKYGHKIFRDLLKADYKVVPINPKGGKILGQKVFETLSAMEKLPDLVITVVPPEITIKIIEQCHELGIKAIWMQPGSGSEEAVNLAEKYNMQVVSNACFMRAEKIWP